jgi:hypothetical protein
MWSRAAPLLLLAVGCSGATPGQGAQNERCPEKACRDEEACIAGTCVRRMPFPASWSVEILPPVGDSVSAVTEIASVNGATTTLATEPLAPLSASFTFISPALIPNNANVTLTIPSKIPGLPDRTFEVRASLVVQPASLRATFSAPANATSGGGVIRLIPIPPEDQRSPPRAFTVRGASAFAFTVIAADDVQLRGRLLDATKNVLQASFVVRAFQDDLVVSDAPMLDATTGNFTLSIPLSAAIHPVRVQIAPLMAAQVHPTYLTADRMLTGNGSYTFVDVNLPPYIFLPNAFNVTIAGDADDAPPISGALVRATTVLPQAEGDLGSASFVDDSVSNEQGLATLSLLPGAGTTLREYEVAVIPPTASKFGTLCRQISIASGGIDGSPPGMVQLNPAQRPVLSGTVLNADGAPVGNVVVAATPGPAPVAGCKTTRPVPALAVSDRLTGRFELPLDNGTYQIDYDPPGGSPFPRLTELDVTMTDDVTRDVNLPRSGVVETTVVGPDGRTPLAGAIVRLYQVRCVPPNCTGPNRVEPWLRSVGRTDSAGRLRAVAPLDTSD